MNLGGVVKAAVTREKLVERFRRNSSVVRTAGLGEKELLRDTLNLFKNDDDLGELLQDMDGIAQGKRLAATGFRMVV